MIRAQRLPLFRLLDEARKASTLVAAAILTLFVTNVHLDYEDSVRRLNSLDNISYMAIARAAPQEPTVALPYHHAQRLSLPWAAGTAARLTRTDVQRVMEVMAYALTLTAALCIAWACWSVNAARPLATIVAVAVILQPFLLRLPLGAPARLPDLGFAAGLTVASLGMVRVKLLLVLAGCLLMALSRQTTLALLPGLLVCLLAVGPLSLRRRVMVMAGATAIACGVYVWSGQLARPFSAASRNLQHLTGLWDWLRAEELSWHRLGALLAFLLRGAVPFLVLSAIAAPLLVAARRTIRLQAFDVGLLLIAAGICAQPILAGPDITNFSNARLCGFALIPLAVLALRLIPPAAAAPLSWPRVWLLSAIIALTSLHHLYTVMGPAPQRAGLFFTLYAAGSVVIGVLVTLWTPGRWRRDQPAGVGVDLSPPSRAMLRGLFLPRYFVPR